MTVELSELGRALKRAQYRHHLGIERQLAAVGTTIVQWDTLRSIDEAPASSAHDLATTTFQSDQSFGTLATRLAEKGLIERVAGPGRRIEHHLTDAGRRMLQTGREVVDAFVGESFAPLSTAEQ